MRASSSSKNHSRFAALDGLRGLAALSVFLSHLNLATFGIHLSGWQTILWRMLAEGPNSVQVLFVLSGFLMASLYPKVESFQTFVGKRYARIFPLLSTIVVFLWIVRIFQIQNTFFELLLLGILALCTRLLWTLVANSKNASQIGNVFLIGFLGLQGVMVGLTLFAVPVVTKLYQTPLPSIVTNLLLLISNITLTTSITQSTPLLTSVLWSLAPEVIFYLLFPIFVLPLARLSSKNGRVVGLFLVLGILKILFDLQPLFYSLLSLDTLSIGRASGFVIGVVVGTWYQQKNNMWQVTAHFLQKPLIQTLVLTSFLALHIWNVITSVGHQQSMLPWYYLASSCSIGLLILLITQEKKSTHFLTTRPLVFLGTISFSLYLIHRTVIEWVEKNLQFFGSLPSPIRPLIIMTTTILGVIVLAYFLYLVVEKLYFRKNNTPSRPIKSAITSKKFKVETSFKPYIAGLLFASILLMLYSSGYPLSLLVARDPIPIQVKKSLLDQPVQIPFESKYNNLSIVGLAFEYEKNAIKNISCHPPSQLQFSIRDRETNTVLFTSSRDAAQVEGNQVFPFGFPPIRDSKHHRYLIELTQTKSPSEEILIDPNQTTVITQYLLPSVSLPLKIVYLIWNRLTFALQQFSVMFGLLFSGWILFLFFRSKLASQRLKKRKGKSWPKKL